jgi:hypothetical protein
MTSFDRLPGLTGPAIQLKVSGKTFTVHEDLICARSRAFKELLQPHRKPVDDDTDCPICHLNIANDYEHLVWCKKGCGQNMHADCVAEWLKRGRNCAYCRTPWDTENGEEIKKYVIERIPENKDPLDKKGTEKEELCAKSFGVYMRFLYGGGASTLEKKLNHLWEETDPRREQYTINLFRLFQIGDALRDPRFKSTILQCMLRSSDPSETEASLPVFRIGPNINSWVRKNGSASLNKFVGQLLVALSKGNIRHFRDVKTKTGRNVQHLVEHLLSDYVGDDGASGFAIRRESHDQKVSPHQGVQSQQNGGGPIETANDSVLASRLQEPMAQLERLIQVFEEYGQ